ncbi:DUF6768 family protein [Planctomycetota bacterium]
MDREQTKAHQNSPSAPDDAPDMTLSSYMRDCYSQRARWILIPVGIGYGLYILPMVFVAVKFFQTDQVRHQILYAVIFICCNSYIGFQSVWAWVMLQRSHSLREIKRLESRISKCCEAMGTSSC